MRAGHNNERAKLRRKLWLREKVILVLAILIDVVLIVGEIVGTVRSEP